MDSKRSEAVGRVQTHKTNRSETSQRELKAKSTWLVRVKASAEVRFTKSQKTIVERQER